MRRHTLMLTMIIVHVLLCSTAAVADDGSSNGRLLAWNAIMDERILQQNVPAIRNKGFTMSDEARLEFLSDWVLANPNRDTIRMAIDFSQTQPRPVAREASTENHRQHSGGELVSPAIDLLAIATKLNALPQLRQKVETWQPKQPEQSLSKAAFLAALDISAGRYEEANEGLQDLLERVKTASSVEAERGAEAIAVWAAIEHPETQETAGDLLFVLYEQARNRKGPRSERWHRHVYSMKQWLEAKLKTAENSRFLSKDLTLKNWQSVSRMTSETCGAGYPVATWETRPGRVRHVTSHDNDYLYYVSPLQGDFVVEADLTTFAYKDIHLGYGNIWAGPGYDLKACLVGEFRSDFPSSEIKPSLTQPGDEMRVRLVVRDGVRSTSINGRVVYEKQQPADGDPWLSIHSAWYANGTVRNLSISGVPRIPDEISLAANEDLPGWLPYFGESAGHSTADWHLEKSAQATDTPVLRGIRCTYDGTTCESLLRYHRPMLEDGTLEYEFFYGHSAANSFAVHPALDRLVFLLSPNGVQTHWVTDGRFDATGLAPDNVIDEPENRRGPETLPFRTDAWNRLQLKLVRDRVDLYLNERMICSRILEPTNQRTFGLFHFADRTEVKVRDLRWNGSWPKRLPPVADQELVEDRVHRLIADGAALPLLLDQNFRNGLPADQFKAYNGKIGTDILEQTDGVHVIRPGGDGFNKFAFGPDLILTGDFEITAAFDDFKTNVANGGNCNCHLMVEIADAAKSSCRLYRKNQSLKDQALWGAIFKTVDGHRKYLFPASSPEESTSGQFRMLRRGNQLFYMYAADDSDSFRVVDTQEVGPDPSASGGIQLVVETEKNGTTSAVWKRLTIRGEKFVPETPAPVSVGELNSFRGELPVILDHDFTKDPGSEIDFRRLGSTIFAAPQTEGLKIPAPGSDNWTASGLILRTGLSADFDLSADVALVRMDTPRANDETSLILQTEFEGPGSPAVEVKYYGAADGSHDVRVQSRHIDNNGQSDWMVHARADVKSLQSLRTTRRGESVYLLYRETPDSEWNLLGGIHIGPGAVRRDGVRLMLHTGGADRESEVRLQKFLVNAAKRDASEQALGPGQPNPGGKMKRLAGFA